MLVNDAMPGVPARAAAAAYQRAMREVALENRVASGMAPTDARWALAVRAATSLEGGRAAILAPERRRCLVALGTRLGLRPFDSSLVIAVVQDGARSGTGALGRDTEDRLLLVPPAGVGPAGQIDAWFTPAALAAATLGVVILYALIRWVTG